MASPREARGQILAALESASQSHPMRYATAQEFAHRARGFRDLAMAARELAELELIEGDLAAELLRQRAIQGLAERRTDDDSA